MNHQAFFVVGHSNWGKSSTLKALAAPPQVRKTDIGGRTFFIRRMSNDDRPNDWVAFIKKLRPTEKPYVIIAMCPTSDAIRLLDDIKGKYQLFFFILRRSYQDSRTITAQEEHALSALGTVQILADRAEATDRASALRAFIVNSG